MELKNIYIFEWLNDEEIQYFDTIAKRQFFKKWEIVINEWDACNDIAYIIEFWSVDVFYKGEKVSSIPEWGIFWEIALIINEPRSASIIAAQDLKVLEFHRNDFIMLYKKSWNFEEIRNKILSRIKKNFYWVKE